MKSINSQNEYVPLRINISLRRDTFRLISEMANDMGISIDEDSVIDLEIDEDLRGVSIPSSCSLRDLKEIIKRRKLS